MSEQAKQQKQVIIDEIKEKLDGAQSAVLVDYMGITVAEADAMRTKLREAEVDYSVYKNTLMKRAVSGTEFEKLSEVMQGPSAIAISKTESVVGFTLPVSFEIGVIAIIRSTPATFAGAQSMSAVE